MIKIPKIDKKIIKRFWPYIDKSEDCWNWVGCVNNKGYGYFKINDKMYLAHRIAYFLYYGQPKNIIMHTCDNPKCCNPKHLKDATYFENIADRDQKGRQAKLKGEDNGRSKLTEDQVKQIRKMDGTLKEIARQFGVAFSQISSIKNRKTWKHVK